MRPHQVTASLGWAPILLWVKRQSAPRDESILLDIDRLTYEDIADPAYRITLYSPKGLNLLTDAFNTEQPLQFGLVCGHIGLMFIGSIVVLDVEIGPMCIGRVRFAVDAPRYAEYDLSNRGVA